MWCANNWRMLQKGPVKGNNWAPKRTELIWQTQEATVRAEMARLVVTNPGKESLALRQMALSSMLANMADAERLALDAEVRRIQREGNSEEEKRR